MTDEFDQGHFSLLLMLVRQHYTGVENVRALVNKSAPARA